MRFGATGHAALAQVRDNAFAGPHEGPRQRGSGLTTRQIDYLVRQEWATTAEDILWRHTKLGLRVSMTRSKRFADTSAGAADSSRADRDIFPRCCCDRALDGGRVLR